MYKFYKQKLYKKYQDELWGHLINKKSFSYNKKSVLLNYRDIVLKSRLRIKTKFKYFRRGFLKNLNYTLFKFKFFRKNIRTVIFSRKQSISTNSLSSVKFKKARRILFRGSKILNLLNFNIFQAHLNCFSKIIVKSASYPLRTTICLYPNNLKIKSFQIINANKKLVFYKARCFLRVNNLQFVIKKKLNLRKQKTFFYSVHIAAPKKKTKKWSLFALKNIYYKKISLFFGFRKVVDFFKVYNLVANVAGSNSFAVFLMLEGRLENFLMRLNLFPSIYFIKKFIQYGNVFVNNKVINYSSYNLNFNEVVSFNKKYYKALYFFIKSQLKKRKIIINLPTFIEADYKLLVAMLIRNPNQFSLTKPLSFNLYTRFLSVNK
jgi:ribosomal protein S4